MISNDIEIDFLLPVKKEDYDKAEDKAALFDSVNKFVQQQTANDESIEEISVTISEWENDGEEYFTGEDGTEFRELLVEAGGTELGEYEEGYKSHDWYSPDEPSLVNYDEDLPSQITDLVKKGFEEFGVHTLDAEEVDDHNRESRWQDALERYESDLADYAYDD